MPEKETRTHIDFPLHQASEAELAACNALPLTVGEEREPVALETVVSVALVTRFLRQVEEVAEICEVHPNVTDRFFGEESPVRDLTDDIALVLSEHMESRQATMGDEHRLAGGGPVFFGSSEDSAG